MIQKQRNQNLDLVKIISCMAVVGLHTFDFKLSILNAMLYYFCCFAIPLFFMSSGYILVNKNNYNLKYVSKKTLNIIKIVFFWTTLMYIVKATYKTIIKKEPINLLDYLIESFGSLFQKGTFFQFWYLGAMIIVYFLLLCFRKFDIVKYALIVSLCIGMLLQILSIFGGFSIQKNVIQTFRIWSWVTYVSLGGYMPSLINKIKEKLKLKTHLLILVLLTMVSCGWQYFVGLNILDDRHAEYFYDDIIIITWSVLLFSFIMRVKLDKTRIIGFISPLIMGIYIIHPLVKKFILHFIQINTPVFAIMFFMIVLVISIAISAIINRIPILNKFIKL